MKENAKAKAIADARAITEMHTQLSATIVSDAVILHIDAKHPQHDEIVEGFDGIIIEQAVPYDGTFTILVLPFAGHAEYLTALNESAVGRLKWDDFRQTDLHSYCWFNGTPDYVREHGKSKPIVVNDDFPRDQPYDQHPEQINKTKIEDWDKLTYIIDTIVETANLGGLAADTENIINIICDALSDIEGHQIADCNAHIRQILNEKKSLKKIYKKHKKYLRSCGIF